MPSAIVTGATGILGREIVHALGAEPQKWSRVHALSRSKKEKYPQNVQHHHIDLTADAKEMAKELKDVEAEYVFFAAYLEKSSEQENWDVNSAMLKNFLDALEITGAAKRLKRVVLTTGAKQYGVHLGPGKIPMEESDPWVEGEDRPPNFYYNQQRILKKAAEGKSWDWVVTYPNDVIGLAHGNFMNLATSLGLYTVVSKELGQQLTFPGCEKFYRGLDVYTYSKLHAEFNLWAAFEPRASNEAFNVVNGDVESWQNMWPKLAHRFGLEVPRKMFDQAEKDASSSKLAEKPPIADVAGERGLEGRVSQGAVEQQIDLVKWSEKADVKEAWARLAKREGLDQSIFGNATWAFLGFVLGRNYDIVLSMSKARKLGWTGYVDTWESLDHTFEQLEAEGVLPKRK